VDSRQHIFDAFSLYAMLDPTEARKLADAADAGANRRRSSTSRTAREAVESGIILGRTESSNPASWRWRWGEADYLLRRAANEPDPVPPAGG
jgi:hypothetical protein